MSGHSFLSYNPNSNKKESYKIFGHYVVHFKCRESHYVVHFECIMHFRYRDCPYILHFKHRDCPYVVPFKAFFYFYLFLEVRASHGSGPSVGRSLTWSHFRRSVFCNTPYSPGWPPMISYGPI